MSCQLGVKSNLHQNISAPNEAFWLTYYYTHLTNLNHFVIKQLTLVPTKMIRLSWLNEKNYLHGCSPIHHWLFSYSPFFWNWKQVKRTVESSRKNGGTDNSLKMVKIFLRWRVNTIAVQHALYFVQPMHFDECCRYLKNKHVV